MASCPPREALQRLLDDQLSKPEEQMLMEHVNTCGSCQEQLEHLTASSAPLGRAADPLDSTPPTLRAAYWVEAAPWASKEASPEGSSGTPERWPELDGYAILGELGRGGMGVVYQARQRGLQRVVAVKMIREGLHAGAEPLARFRREAEAVARLQHPHIVQIYAIGEHAGRPYFAMEYVPGGSLADHLDGTPVNAQVAAGLVEVLAGAVQAAHTQGIIHRDLKPGNILLSPKGGAATLPSPDGAPRSPASLLQHWVPKISDFGLAKDLTSEAGGGGAQTGSGAVLGSPSYMAPEQAQGKHTHVGPAADVYGLGTILYELLTGRPPFKAETPLDTLVQVVHEEPVPPRRLQPKLPRDVEIICLTCLHKNPARRYSSALALAEDLRRFQAGEPIRARAVGVMEWSLKWARRRPAVATLLLVSVAAAAALVLAQQRYTAKLEDSLKQTEGQRQRADGNLRLAREAVDKTVTKITEDARLKQANFQQLRQDLLAAMVPFYEQFVQQQQTDLDLAAERGLAYAKLASLRGELGDKEGALAEYERMQGIFEQLVGESPAKPNFRKELATSSNNVGLQLQYLGRLQQAEAAYRAAVTGYRRLAADFPVDPSYRKLSAMALVNLATLLSDLGRSTEWEQAYRDALDFLKQLTTDFPNVAEYRQNLAMSQNNFAIRLRRTGRPQEAEKAYRDALTVQEQLVADFPKDADYRQYLARTRNNLGFLLVQTGRAQEAEKIFREAVATYQELFRTFPDVASYRQELGTAHNNLGALLSDLGKLPEAEKAYHAALDLQRPLVATHPTEPRYRQELARSNSGLGDLLAQLERKEEAERVYREALTHLKQLTTDFPAVLSYRQELASLQSHLGMLLDWAGRQGEAETVYRETLALQKQLTADFPDRPDCHDGLAATMVRLAGLLQERNDFSQARILLEDALPHHQAALKANPRNPAYRRSFVNNRAALVGTLAGVGDHDRASQAAEQLATVGWDPARDSYKAACALALCLPVVQQDAKLAEVGRRNRIQAYTEQTLRMLRQAVRKGYRDAAQTKRDPDLAPLRDHPEFAKLLEEMAAETQPNDK